MTPENIRYRENEPQPNLRTLGKRLAAYGHAVEPYINPLKNLESSVRARTVMNLVAEQLIAGDHTIRLPGALIGGDNDCEEYQSLLMTGNHYLIAPKELKWGSEYGMTGMTFTRQFLHFLENQYPELDPEFMYLPRPEGYNPEWFLESSATIMLPDTEKNQRTSWVDADAGGFILGPKVSNFWEKVPWGGNPEHEMNHKKRALWDPIAYLLADNNNSLFNEMLALAREWLISCQYASFQEQRSYDGKGYAQIRSADDLKTVNPYRLARQWGLRSKHVSYNTARNPFSTTIPPVFSNPSHLQNSNFTLTTVNQHMISGMPAHQAVVDFDSMNSPIFSEPAYYSRSTLALWNESLQSAIAARFKGKNMIQEINNLLTGNVAQFYEHVQPLHNLRFCDSNFQFITNFRRDLHGVLKQVNGHLTLTELLDTYYSSMTARLMQDTLQPREDLFSSEQLLQIVQREAPQELSKQMEIRKISNVYGNHSWISDNVREFILLPVLGDLIFKRILEAGGMRDRIEHIWMSTGEKFYDQTIAKMQLSVTEDGVPLKYVEPRPFYTKQAVSRH